VLRTTLGTLGAAVIVGFWPLTTPTRPAANAHSIKGAMASQFPANGPNDGVENSYAAILERRWEGRLEGTSQTGTTADGTSPVAGGRVI
jgi:hypothetical protein